MNTDTNETEVTNKQEFYKIIKEFIPDLLHTFPEYKESLHQGIIDVLQDNVDTEDATQLYDHCLSVYPERFFDILYQNKDIFVDTSKKIFFLPNIDFVKIWADDISDKTRNVIWKYLQLILFSVLSDVKHEKSFGDTAKLFEAINEDELKTKLEKTLEEMQNVFDMGTDGEEAPIDGSNINLENLPDPDEIHSHINGMLGGKLGALAREIAEETAQDLDIDVENATNVNDVFQKMFRNPGKLMNMVKNIGSKIETKIQSGEIKESDLMKEAGEMMTKMNTMPGMGNIKSMLKQFGLPLGKGSKVNMGAFQAHMNQNMRQSKMRERLQHRLAQRQTTTPNVQSQQSINAQDITDSVVEKTPRVKKNKKRRKRKKNKEVAQVKEE